MSITTQSCRTCLHNNGSISVFGKHNNLLLVDMIFDCTNVKMNLDDGYLKTICKNCVEKLDAAYAFKQECENSDRLMQTFFFQNFLAKSNVYKNELETKFLEVDWGNQLENEADDLNIDSKVSLKIEIVNVPELETNQNETIEKSENYECDLCLKVYKRKQHLTRHKSIIHKEGNEFKCEVCDRAFQLKKSLMRHSKTHSKMIINKKIDCADTEITHSEIIEDDTLPQIKLEPTTEYKCEICSKVFNHKRYLNMHMKRHEKKQFICEICSKQFWFSHDLHKHHKLTHLREKNHECETCNRRFSSKNVLKVHLRIHTGEKPYKCKYCDKAFRDMSGMNNHTKLHTGEKHHQCEICLKTYSRPSHLLNHKRSHTGEKPFQCQICHESFSRNYYLIVHLRKHTGIKPFKCKFCEKPFRLRQNRMKHERIHTGEKPYKCGFCESKYTDSYNLGIHVKHYCQNNPNRTKKISTKVKPAEITI